MLHPNVDKSISSSFKWVGVIALIILVIGMGISIYKKIPKDLPPPGEPATVSRETAPVVTSGKRSVPVTAPYGVDQTGNPVCSEKVDISGNLDYNFRPADGEPGGCILVVLNGKQNKVCRDESIPLGLKKLKNQEKAEIQFCSLENRRIRMVLDIYQAGA